MSKFNIPLQKHAFLNLVAAMPVTKMASKKLLKFGEAGTLYKIDFFARTFQGFSNKPSNKPLGNAYFAMNFCTTNKLIALTLSIVKSSMSQGESNTLRNAHFLHFIAK